MTYANGADTPSLDAQIEAVNAKLAENYKDIDIAVAEGKISTVTAKKGVVTYNFTYVCVEAAAD